MDINYDDYGEMAHDARLGDVQGRCMRLDNPKGALRRESPRLLA